MNDNLPIRQLFVHQEPDEPRAVDALQDADGARTGAVEIGNPATIVILR